MPKYAAIYARTSSPNQKYNYSIQEQIDQCFNFCENRGWVANHVFIDECESGGNIDRPKFQQMLHKAESGYFDIIVCWKLDRFCRSLVDLVNTERELGEWDVNLCSVTEYIDTTTPVGRFNFRSLASVAEFERELIGQRARMGLHALAKQHKWANPHPPLGYDRDKDGKLLINPKEKNLVIYIFELYIEKRSMPQVAFELNQQNILTKKQNRWNARAVRDILTNELYIGNYSVAGFQDYVDEYRIIRDKLFSEARKIRLRFQKKGSKRKEVPKNRKQQMVEKIYTSYIDFLDKMEVGAPHA
ncbi:MAG: recombinase family protein [Candidatus Heimdallarchaeaceae archaeon]